MFLRDCELTLKSEAGHRTRRGIYIRQLRYPNALFIVNRARQILNTDGPRLPICWLRYSRQRELALGKYVFAWLGLEKLAGDADIEKAIGAYYLRAPSTVESPSMIFLIQPLN